MNLPDFPKPLARLIAALPAYPASRAFVALGNLVAWPGLRDQDWTEVMGQHMCVQVQDLGLRVHFSLGQEGFRAEAAGTPATTFTATARDLARLALRLEDPDTLFFDRRLRIEGDYELGASGEEHAGCRGPRHCCGSYALADWTCGFAAAGVGDDLSRVGFVPRRAGLRRGWASHFLQWKTWRRLAVQPLLRRHSHEPKA